MKVFSKVICIFFLMNFSLFCNITTNYKDLKKIVIYYGMRSGHYPLYIPIKSLAEKKIVIENKELRIYALNLYEEEELYFKKKLDNSEYIKIKEIVNKTLSVEEKSACGDINDRLHNSSPKSKVRLLYSKVLINEEESKFCYRGPTKILLYLNEKYELDIQWAKEVIFL